MADGVQDQLNPQRWAMYIYNLRQNFDSTSNYDWFDALTLFVKRKRNLIPESNLIKFADQTWIQNVFYSYLIYLF